MSIFVSFCAALAAALIVINVVQTWSVSGFVIFAALFNVMLWRVQTLLISAAKSAADRVPMGGFWVFFGVCFALILTDVFAIG